MGEGGKQGVARLLVTGCGIAVSEIFGAIREDRNAAFKFASLPPNSIYRSLSLMGAKILFAGANAF